MHKTISNFKIKKCIKSTEFVMETGVDFKTFFMKEVTPKNFYLNLIKVK